MHRLVAVRSEKPTALSRVVLVGTLALAACGSHRSVDNVQGEVVLGPAVTRVRIEVENGRVDLAPRLDELAAVTYRGGVRRMAETAEMLATLESLPLEFAVERIDDGRTLVLRAPSVPEGVEGMIAFEAGIRMPASLPVEVLVTGNGHVTMADRAAPTRVDTRRGDLRFENCAGGIEATTGSGNVIGFGIRGDMDVRTRRGDMQAFLAEPGEKLTLETGQGTIQCRVPPDTEFEIDARVAVGRIGGSFGLEARQVGEFGAEMVGRRGLARTKVVLRSDKGHIGFAPHEPR